MIVEIGSELRKYYADNDRDFFFVLRSELIWDVSLFERLEGAMVKTVEELEGAESVPRWLLGTFAWQVGAIAGIAQRDDIMVNPHALESERRRTIQEGVARLRRVQLRFCEGQEPA